MNCKHFRFPVCVHPTAETSGTGVHPATCARCPHYDGPSRGLGDTVHKALDAVGVHRVIKACGGCAARRQALNDAVPFDSKKS
jgi:hypothetical protein